MIILFLLLAIASLFWLYFLIKARDMDRKTSALRGPPTLPIVGNGMLFIGNTQKILKNIESIANIAVNDIGCAKIWLGLKLYVAIGNPEDAQVVLENCLDKDGVYRFLRPWLGHGLFVAPVGLWKVHRKVLLPVFHNKIVEKYLGVIAEQSNVLLKRLGEQTGKGEFDVLSYITACTLDIVFETAMGERMDVQHSPETPYLRARHIVMEILNKRLFKIWLQPDFLFNMTSYAKLQKENINLTHKFTDEISDYLRKLTTIPYISYPPSIIMVETDWREILRYLKIQKRAENKVRAVLDMLFGREIEFTDEQLREHIDSITIAGNDTTALVIAYTLVLLGNHQEAQEKAFQEQQEIFGNSKRGATKDDLLQMYFLERVVKESMRLYTVVPIIARNIEKDTYLPFCKVTLPAGAGAVVGSFAIHRSKTVWGSDAEEFNPDRFLPERSGSRHPAAFLPFSYGSRNCIGRNFGMLIIKSIISSVIRSFRIEADPIGPLKIEMLLFPIRGHQIKVAHR